MCVKESCGCTVLYTVSLMTATYVADDHAYRYLGPHLAALDANGTPALLSYDGERSHTHPAIDMYMLALTLVYVYFGKLPDQINVDLYDGRDRAEYLTAVRDFAWEGNEQLNSLPSEMRDWLLWALQEDPLKKPQSADEALNHPWLTAERQLVDAAVQDASQHWQDLHALIREAMH